MRSRVCNAWCGLFTTATAGVAALTGAAIVLPRMAGSYVREELDSALHMHLSLRNKSVDMAVPEDFPLPLPPFTVIMKMFEFMTGELLSEESLEKFKHIPKFIEDNGGYFVAALGGMMWLNVISQAALWIHVSKKADRVVAAAPPAQPRDVGTAYTELAAIETGLEQNPGARPGPGRRQG